MRVLILCQIHAPPRHRVGNTITPTAQGPVGLRSEAANPPIKRTFQDEAEPFSTANATDSARIQVPILSRLPGRTPTVSEMSS